MRTYRKAGTYSALVTTVFVVTIATYTAARKVETIQDKHDDKAELYADQVTLGEQNLDHPEYFEGDIRLTPKQHDYIQNVKDGLYTRALTSFANKLWPNGDVPYSLDSSLSSPTKEFIDSAIAEWNGKTCINIRPKGLADTDYIEFTYEGGCSSNVGMIGGRQTISVGSADSSVVCQHGNIVHEIAHTLGYFHEHSRPDRDAYVTIKAENVKDGYIGNFAKMGDFEVNSRGVGYDYGSITHYGLRFFSKNGRQTIEAKQAVPSDVVIGQREALSDYDVKQAKLLYSCPDASGESEEEVVEDANQPQEGSTEASNKPKDNKDKIEDQVKVGELNLEHPEYFEGDIRLTPNQQNLLNDAQVDDGLQPRALLHNLDRLWPNGQVPYKLGFGLRSQTIDFIKSAVEEWNAKTCINIRPKKLFDTNFVEFVYEGGCSSNVGMIGGRQTISVGSFGGQTCTHGNIVHELAHTLGYFHEHSRPDRDAYIRVNWGSIKPGYYNNFKKMSNELVNSLGVPYDYDSITHYGVKFFTNNGLQTIQPLQTVPPGAQIGQRIKLSDYDVQQANLLYKCQVAARKNKVGTIQDKPVFHAPNPEAEEIVKPQENQAEIDDQVSNGELNLDHPEYYEGDILLTQKQHDYIASSRVNDGLQTRGLSSDPTILWPNGEVPYVLHVGLRDETKANIQSAIEEWRAKTDGCINFREKQPSDFHYIEFAYHGGCSSNIGMVMNRQYVSVGGKGGATCTHGNIVHELAHVLGFYHEQSRPDRDNHITIAWKNINRVFLKNFHKEDFRTINSKGIPYDFKSVMHYGPKFFAKSSDLQTIETKPPGKMIGQRVGLSPLDVKQTKLLYKCDSKNVRKSEVNKKTNSDTDMKNKTTKNTEKPTHLKNAVRQFVQSTRNKYDTEKKLDVISQKFDSMIASSEQIGLDSGETPLNENEKQFLAELKKVAKNGKDEAEDISGEENLGKHYYEGDMVLSDKQRQWFDSMTKESSPASKRALISNPTFLWQNKTMPYLFHDKVDKISRDYALAAIKHWEEKTCLRFPKRNTEKNYVLFVFEGGCSSRVGRVGGMQKINIGSKTSRCKIGNIIHEMGHALGFFHEQSRPDRDRYVQVLGKNIIGWYRGNFHKFNNDFIDSLGVPYDFNSIMHYGRAFFSRNHLFFPTLVPLFTDINYRPVHIGQRDGLSDMDILQGNLLYKCDGKERLTKEQSERLYKIAEQRSRSQSGGQVDDEALCKDRYDTQSCTQIKDRGYCHRFPRTMRHSCGHTCQLCGTTPPQFIKSKKENLYTKLKLH